MKIIQAINEEEAREQAIDWQAWQAKKALSYEELIAWSDYFTSIAEEYDLIDEFKENGII